MDYEYYEIITVTLWVSGNFLESLGISSPVPIYINPNFKNMNLYMAYDTFYMLRSILWRLKKPSQVLYKILVCGVGEQGGVV